MGKITIQLTEPIMAHDHEVGALEIRTPRGKDFKQIEGRSMENPFRLILDFAAILADVPPSSLDGLSAKDVQEVVKVIGPFLGESPKIGAMY